MRLSLKCLPSSRIFVYTIQHFTFKSVHQPETKNVTKHGVCLRQSINFDRWFVLSKQEHQFVCIWIFKQQERNLRLDANKSPFLNVFFAISLKLEDRICRRRQLKVADFLHFDKEIVWEVCKAGYEVVFSFCLQDIASSLSLSHWQVPALQFQFQKPVILAAWGYVGAMQMTLTHWLA